MKVRKVPASYPLIYCNDATIITGNGLHVTQLETWYHWFYVDTEDNAVRLSSAPSKAPAYITKNIIAAPKSPATKEYLYFHTIQQYID